MKCKACGAELSVGEKICHGCGAPVEEAGNDTEISKPVNLEKAVSAPEESEAAAGGAETADNRTEGLDVNPEETDPVRKSGKKKGIIIGVAAAAAVAVGGLVFGVMSRKDPKEVVIHAFETIYTEDQVNPWEELFGWSQFTENAKTADMEISSSLVLDNCSAPEVQGFWGSGIRITGKDDKTNKKKAASLDVIYKDMDLASLNVYYEDQTLMLEIPELSSKVFTMDLSEGLAERIKQSPMLGSIVDEAVIDYASELFAQAKSGQTEKIDVKALMNRYREGTQAQEKLKEALLVERGEKRTYLMDGQEVTCDGYEVIVSKNSMIEFLRVTTDFFLNDQELKEQYLRQLERAVSLIELINGEDSGISAGEMYQENMENVKETIDQGIDFLDKYLNDVVMTVYVDKKGRLAAVTGATELVDSEIDRTTKITFDFLFQGGSYLTQNMTAKTAMEHDGETLSFSMEKIGSYDGKKLSNDVSLDVELNGVDGFQAGFSYKDDFDSENGDYDSAFSFFMDNSLTAYVSVSGVVDKLEKGTLFHMDVDELKVTIMDGAMASLTMSGEYSYGPLEEEVTALEGETFDLLEANETQWQSVFMEIYLSLMQLASQLSM